MTVWLCAWSTFASAARYVLAADGDLKSAVPTMNPTGLLSFSTVVPQSENGGGAGGVTTDTGTEVVTALRVVENGRMSSSHSAPALLAIVCQSLMICSCVVPLSSGWGSAVSP